MRSIDQSPEVVADKKKKRRSTRKPKQIPHALGSSVNEIYLEPQHPLNFLIPNEQCLPKASNVAFDSLPTMHVDKQAMTQQGRPTQQYLQSDSSGRMLSRSCPEPVACEASMACSGVRTDFHLSRQNESHAQRKYFAPHWSPEAVNGALEKGDVFKALFRVNAHNRLEAYCKIDGVPTDILVSGIAAQNRAVEGDIVVIKVDPSSLWTKMKGSSGGASSNAAVVDDSNSVSRVSAPVGDGCKGKGKADADCSYISCRNVPEKGYHNARDTCFEENVSPELNGQPGNIHANGIAWDGYPSEHNAVQNLCAMISAYPSKRPTGKVVAIIEQSSRRDAVVGFLNVKQWVFNREGYIKDNKKNKLPLLSSYREYIQLIPTDPKFPIMMVPVRSLPDSIKKRLEEGDATVETELVAAQVVDWGEEYNVPKANVVRVFGRSGEIEPHIAAILFENAIRSCEFSPETLSSLPQVPWVIPVQEVQARRDIRKLCLFTIDPATAFELDDALSVEWLSPGICRVGVHIADVSYFVLPDTALDMEAQIRSTSVYLSQRKLSMLPSLLSDLSSLIPGVERLAFSIFWDINTSGEVLDRWIGRTVIKSCCKLSYDHAQDIIDGLFDGESYSTSENTFPPLHGQFKWSDVVKSIKSLHSISKTLKKKRFNDGALSIENPKVAFLFDEDGIPYDSVTYGLKESNFLVEEFMLLANRTAAEVITRAYPSTSLLRRHPEPNPRKLREFEAFCGKHGLDLDTSSSAKLQLSLERIRQELENDTVLFDILMSYATRSMQLAAYFCSGNLEASEKDWCHYGLAVPIYTHFTSPLRRYPDIVVHRTLAAAVEAEEAYMKHKRTLHNFNGEERTRRCLTGLLFDKDAVESLEAQEALSAAASKHNIPCTDVLASVAAHCNERKLASRNVKDASDKLYMWVLLRKKEVLFSEARVVGLGPRFMSIYVNKLAVERRIYYDEVEGLAVDWLDATSTLVLSMCVNKRVQRRGSPVKCRPLEEAVFAVSPCELIPAVDISEDNSSGAGGSQPETSIGSAENFEPAFFPLTIRLLSTITVALHAVGGEDGPLDIAARLYISSYFSQE